MPGIRRYHEDGAAYFVTTATHNRKPIFADSGAAELLLTVLTYQKYDHGFCLFGFVIMPDHFHAIIQPSGDSQLSIIMKAVKGNFSRMYKAYCEHTGHVWQRRFYDRGIRDTHDLRTALEYIHNNPVAAGLTEDRLLYRYSSARCYHSPEPVYVALVDRWQA